MATTFWMQTVSGQAWDLENPKAEDVRWRDIAHSLARIPRFNGHAKAKWDVSVAQHSLNVSAFLQDSGASFELQLHGLLHDAHEAFLGDMTTPVAQTIAHFTPSFREVWRYMKATHDAAIFLAAGLDLSTAKENKAAVEHADRAVIMAEREFSLETPPRPWADALENTTPADLWVAKPLGEDLAANVFMSRLKELHRKKALAEGTVASDYRGLIP